MRYLTHEFAHGESVDRARRWLIQAGIAPDRIRVHHHGVPRLTVAAEASEVDGIELVIHAAERCDPEGLPGLWDLPHVHEECEDVVATPEVSPTPRVPSSFSLAWHPDRPAVEETTAENPFQRTNRGLRD